VLGRRRAGEVVAPPAHRVTMRAAWFVLLVLAGETEAALSNIGHLRASRGLHSRTAGVVLEEDMRAAFAAQLKQQKEQEAKEKKAKAAQERKARPRNRLGADLDLGNRPQNFFRGIAERDANLQRARDNGDTFEQAGLMDESDKQIWIGGLALIAAFFLANWGFSTLEQQQYQDAVDSKNYELVQCLDTAFSFSEKNICKLKY
jgi:hypothetical protein